MEENRFVQFAFDMFLAVCFLAAAVIPVWFTAVLGGNLIIATILVAGPCWFSARCFVAGWYRLVGE